MAGTIDFGIDLGTTNSSIALCREGVVRVFHDADRADVTPSVVYVGATGRLLVGRKAYANWVADPRNTQAEFKRWMGYSDKLKFPASAREFSAEELSAEVLKSLRGEAEMQTQEQIKAAVITVPAAFGSLQCEATERAARLAGIEQSPLLQEPVAAAIAYGASPASRDQRWMVFDLGGGTLDIAIVSTRNDRLAVLEHQGNNRLGGKDFDRAIAEQLLLAPLNESFKLPTAQSDSQAHRRLMRALVRQAEQAKISLSISPSATVELFDLGNDVDGKPIELTLTLSRGDVEARIGPLLEQCLELAYAALAGARLKADELDRVLLVGGPTQMPAVRAALRSALGDKLDHSLDPMTVVSHGAALYASTIACTTASASTVSPAGARAATPAPQGEGQKSDDAAEAKSTSSGFSLFRRKKPRAAVTVELAYERASGSARSPVAGVISEEGVGEIKIDAVGGFWTSGWVKLQKGSFAIDVVLDESRPVTRYTLSGRDERGDAVGLIPAEFAITFMLPMGAPLLPHTLAVELSSLHGKSVFDPIFPRASALPAEARRTYKAQRTLRPSEFGSTLPIKFWEIEVSNDAQEKWWAGSVHLRAAAIKRPVMENSDIELLIKIDASRRLSVEMFVPALNQSFSQDVYVPDPPTARSHLQQQLELCFERINFLQGELYARNRGELVGRLEMLREQAEEMAVATEAAGAAEENDDPDAVLRPTEALRRLRLALTQIEEQLGVEMGSATITAQLRREMPYMERVMSQFGMETEAAEFQQLREQYGRYVESNDLRGLAWVRGQLWDMHQRIFEESPEYWRDRLANAKLPGRRYVNHLRAQQQIEAGDQAQARGDLPALRRSVRALWELTKPDAVETARDQATTSGLRET